MVVKNKQTGQVGTLPDNQFDPKLYEAVGSPAQKTAPVQQQPPTPDPLSMQDGTPPVQQPAQPAPSLAENVGKIGMNVAASVVNPVVDLYNKAVSTTADNAQHKGKLDIADALKKTADVVTSPEAGKVAAETASFAVPYGKAGFAGSKFLIPGAAQGGLMGVAEGDKPEEILGDTILGAGAGVATKAVSAGLPAVTKGVKTVLTQGAEDASKKMALKGLKPSPSQQARFYKETGEKLDDFLVNNNLAGADASTIDNAITPIQDQFDSVASNPDLIVDGKGVVNKFDDEIKRLSDSVLPADQTKAKTMQSIRDNFIAKYGNEGIGADALTTLRKDVDAGIRDFNLDPAVKAPLNLVRDILQGSIRESADTAGISVEGKSLKDVGMQLSKLYKLQEIADRQQFNGQSTLPLSLTSLLGAGAGSAAGGLPGAIVGGVMTSAANSPKTSGAVAKVLGGISDRAEGMPVVPPFNDTANNIAGQSATRGAVDLPTGAPVQNPPQNDQLDNTHITTDSTTTQPESQVSYVTGNSPEQHAQAYIAALQAGDKASATQIKGLYDMEVKYQADNKAKTKPPTAKQNQLSASADGAQQALDLLESGKVSVGPVAGRIETLKSSTIGTSKEEQDFMGTIAIARSALLNAYLGGNIPPSEYERISAGIPTVNDPTDTARQKLITFIREVRRAATGEVQPDVVSQEGLDINNATLQQ